MFLTLNSKRFLFIRNQICKTNKIIYVLLGLFDNFEHEVVFKEKFKL